MVDQQRWKAHVLTRCAACNGVRYLPAAGTARGGLEGFTIVDVSIEPYDGNPEHSRDSQVRGTLPE